MSGQLALGLSEVLVAAAVWETLAAGAPARGNDPARAAVGEADGGRA